MARTHADVQTLARRHAAGVARLRHELEEPDPAILPDLVDDVHDARGLVGVERVLFGG